MKIEIAAIPVPVISDKFDMHWFYPIVTVEGTAYDLAKNKLYGSWLQKLLPSLFASKNVTIIRTKRFEQKRFIFISTAFRFGYMWLRLTTSVKIPVAFVLDNKQIDTEKSFLIKYRDDKDSSCSYRWDSFVVSKGGYETLIANAEV